MVGIEKILINLNKHPIRRSDLRIGGGCMFKPRKKVILSKFTTFGTGGPAEYFYEAKDIKETKDSVLFAQKNNLELKVLGSGSNILVSDAGTNCFVVKMNIKGIFVESVNDKYTRIVANAGEKFDDIVAMSVENKLHGLENLSWIPGTVGATPVHNIGAYGVEVSDVIEWIEVLNMDTLETYKLSSEDCDFRYRDSMFKNPKNKNLIILKVSYLLNNKYDINIEYDDIKEFFDKKTIVKPTLINIRDAIIHTRKQKLPDIKCVGSAGSFFKNPIVSKNDIKRLLILYPELVIYPYDKLNKKVSAAWLIDKVGKWRGYKKSSVGVHGLSALVLINYGNATSKNIFNLAEKIRKDIKEKTSINLEYEVNLIGTF